MIPEGGPLLVEGAGKTRGREGGGTESYEDDIEDEEGEYSLFKRGLEFKFTWKGCRGPTRNSLSVSDEPRLRLLLLGNTIRRN